MVGTTEGHDHSHGSDHGHSHSHDGPSHSHDHHHPSPRGAPGAMDADDDEDVGSPASESAHQATVVATFDSYLRRALSANQRRRGDYYCLSEEHRALLPGYNDLLKQVDEKLRVNGQLVEAMIDSNVFPPDPDAALSAPAPKESDHEKLRSTLRQCVRDWSEQGKQEREETYTPILDALSSYFRDIPIEKKSALKVLVPGAGLGRLAWEIVNAGYSCQANEFSLFMLVASAFILNHTSSKKEFELYPFLHSFSNIRSRTDLLKPILIPDVLPSDIANSRGDFSFAAGTFEEVYKDDQALVHDQPAGVWDSVVTCFFIDTARNIVEYLTRIYTMLKPGGVWINCGPTLWHFENTDGARSIELTLEEVKELAKRIGFTFQEDREIKTSYTSNQLSLLRHQYTAGFWTNCPKS
ncbi:N2227-domain-containing protein [Meredithblackwellia eburnea MCA 4105]